MALIKFVCLYLISSSNLKVSMSTVAKAVSRGGEEKVPAHSVGVVLPYRHEIYLFSFKELLLRVYKMAPTNPPPEM